MVIGLVCITVGASAWSLWSRRVAWFGKWEAAVTVNVMLQGIGFFLMSPMASAVVGGFLHSAVGHWNVEDMLGHQCGIASAAVIALNMVGRLEDAGLEKRNFKLYVEGPATIAFPVLMMLFMQSENARGYAVDFFRVPTDMWLAAYWVVLCGVMIWLLGYAFRATLILRRDSRSFTVATMYLFALGCGICACLCRIVMTLLPTREATGLPASLVMWGFGCAAAIGYAAAAAFSWSAKKKWFDRDHFWFHRSSIRISPPNLLG